ncbi:MAG: DUF2071 domain-containing protein [Pirellulaceae bacterium]|jgi:hypothetical protein|nr:DUF2071 domain-containing protein [Pirellulaceae bacterium]MDP7018659.1 DUF2071 domain-containing protein [Pirellulaceae bacterium]
MIDRIGPTRRPAGGARGFHNWRSLLFMHWCVPVEQLRPLVPDELELDLYEDKAYVGVVPFAMEGVRARWWPAQLAFSFLETNVRTYVHHRGRPGVYFLSLEAEHRPAVWAARRFWGLPYHHAAMTMRADGDDVHYESVRSGSRVKHEVDYRVGATLGPSRPGTLEHFFLERYLLFVERGGHIYSGQVYHTPYPAHAAEVLQISDELIAAAGIDGVQGQPEFAHYSPGVDVEIFDLQRVNNGDVQE